MTDPPQFGSNQGPSPWPQPPAPPPGHPYQQPYVAAYSDPAAPYGRHPITGEPYSDKSKLVAGLLQLLGIFGVVGIGRMYLGDVGLGIAQLIVGICTFFIGAWIWGIIDAILILTDHVRDPYGRPLRDGA
jgi:TM2 domain-containing membrane protein YozV